MSPRVLALPATSKKLFTPLNVFVHTSGDLALKRFLGTIFLSAPVLTLNVVSFVRLPDNVLFTNHLKYIGSVWWNIAAATV